MNKINHYRGISTFIFWIIIGIIIAAGIDIMPYLLKSLQHKQWLPSTTIFADKKLSKPPPAPDRSSKNILADQANKTVPEKLAIDNDNRPASKLLPEKKLYSVKQLKSKKISSPVIKQPATATKVKDQVLFQRQIAIVNDLL